MPPVFSLPSDGELFTEQILKRCENLITSGIWNGVNKIRLDTWMTNFANSTERYFAASVLDALIFRSEKQTVAMMETLFQRTLPDFLRRSFASSQFSTSWLELLQEANWSSDPSIRIVPVIREDDPPAKSGPALCRLYRRYLALNQKWMIWPWQIKDFYQRGVRQFLFVDDFLGTGDQFIKFSVEFNLTFHLAGCRAVYAPLVAHQSGIDAVHYNLPCLKVAPTEVIDDSYNLFATGSSWFDDGVNSPESAREFYNGLVTKADFALSSTPLAGFGDLSLAYAFEHATPDNCLPIIWAQGRNWKPLLER